MLTILVVLLIISIAVVSSEESFEDISLLHLILETVIVFATSSLNV